MNIDQKIKELETRIAQVKDNTDVEDLYHMIGDIAQAYNENIIAIDKLYKEVKAEAAKIQTAKPQNGILVDYETFSKLVNLAYAGERYNLCDNGLADHLIDIGKEQQAKKADPSNGRKAPDATGMKGTYQGTNSVHKPHTHLDKEQCSKCSGGCHGPIEHEMELPSDEEIKKLTEVYNRFGSLFAIDPITPDRLKELLKKYKK